MSKIRRIAHWSKIALEALIIVATLSALIPLWQFFSERDDRALQAKTEILQGYSACIERLRRPTGEVPPHGAWGLHDIPDQIITQYCQEVLKHILSEEDEKFADEMKRAGFSLCKTADGSEAWCI